MPFQSRGSAGQNKTKKRNGNMPTFKYCFSANDQTIVIVPNLIIQTPETGLGLVFMKEVLDEIARLAFGITNIDFYRINRSGRTVTPIARTTIY